MITLFKPQPNGNAAPYNFVPSLFSEQITQSIQYFIQQLETIAIHLRSSYLQSLEIQKEEWILEAIRQVINTEQVLRVCYDLDQKNWKIESKNIETQNPSFDNHPAWRSSAVSETAWTRSTRRRRRG